MYRNIGGKIKMLALVCCAVGIAISILSGISASVTENKPVLGVAVILIGCLLSWIGSFATYGLGELIETTMDNNRQLHRIEKDLRRLLEDRQ